MTILMKPLDRAATAADTISLMWDYGPNHVNPNLRAGALVTRTEKADDTLELSYPYKLPTDDSIAAGPSRALAFPGHRATIYVDEEQPSRLHVNFWPPVNPIPRTDSPTVHLTPEEVRDIDYYFQLKNRQSLQFRYHARTIGAVTIPIQYRPGYRANNGQQISASVGTGLTTAVYGGYTWGRVRYTYLNHGDNEIQKDWSITLGGFFGASTVEVDSATSLSAAKPVTSETNVGVLSPGLTVLAGFRGLEFGLFGGVDFAVGSVAHQWDYDRRAWLGLGVGFNVWSLLGK
ncbi:hypothetical protein [Longimicrobium sp.]|uniref:hypothetical protein n=1 Tax=Longimicrobium sp. TaxID=2029185 RepID=UPI002CF93C0A|nr:hypothetical protein [Longimicrobium sp.]HSU12534.1 hypothetical protein [Longimicrobium sp.]